MKFTVSGWYVGDEFNLGEAPVGVSAPVGVPALVGVSAPVGVPALVGVSAPDLVVSTVPLVVCEDCSVGCGSLGLFV